MRAVRRTGLIIGVLIVIQMVAGGVVNFALEAPLFGAPGFLINAAAHSRQLGLAALLGLVMEGMWLVVAIVAFPVFAQRSQSMAVCLVALAAVVLALAAAENAAVMSMVSFSEAYTKASPAAQEQIELVRVVITAPRNWAHYTARIFDGVLIFVFYLTLYRFALVPRALAGFGLIAVTLMLTGLAMPFFGHPVVFPLLAPLGLSQLLLAVWLIAKEFREQAAA